ncbi:hypothetical protein C8A05DRAFT_47272 [Staphylotrichum tortipilum]|uniref:Aminoglycoside phosphotransferase domain-containing protein n=1 Tax=Staphylotrichum tortipilum TaxID=2831512 RepID=A0AAN6MDD4_9PEZI|nr:hypothetical protein C8A05DRAFT_47272 [Staphylotrichum longicolle]
MKQILLNNGLGTLRACRRLGNGAYGTTYEVTVEEPDKPQLIVQLRFHGNVASMNALQEYIRAWAPRGLPVPRSFPALSWGDRGDGLQLQVTEFVPGTMADDLFKRVSIEDRALIVRQMARAFAALWELPVVRADAAIGDAVGPETQDGVGGPFNSVSSFLRAWILHRLAKLDAQNGIDEYKALLLPSIRSFVQDKLDSRLAQAVDKVPVVLMHSDLGLHNVLLSKSPPSPRASPFLCAVPRLVEPMLRQGSDGEETNRLREVFGNEIPLWKHEAERPESQAFLEWFEFGLCLKANAYMKFDESPEERMAFWRQNILVVERFLGRWGQDGPSL